MSDRDPGCECPSNWSAECINGRVVEYDHDRDGTTHDGGPCPCSICHPEGADV